MQKRLLYSTAVLAALALGSCSNDETLNGGLPETTGTNQVIEISVANAGSGLTTRAGRPLLSSEAKQTIENVKIIVCDESGNIKADTLITDWTTVSEAYNDASGHGQRYASRWAKPMHWNKVPRIRSMPSVTTARTATRHTIRSTP